MIDVYDQTICPKELQHSAATPSSIRFVSDLCVIVVVVANDDGVMVFVRKSRRARRFCFNQR